MCVCTGWFMWLCGTNALKVGTGTLQETIGLGFREEGALELRSSTEELYFMDAEQKKEEQERIQQQQQQVSWEDPVRLQH